MNNYENHSRAETRKYPVQKKWGHRAHLLIFGGYSFAPFGEVIHYDYDDFLGYW